MPELYPEDQAKVDAFLSSNVNDIERKPFRPFILLLIILFVLLCLSGLAFLIAEVQGVL